MTAPSPPRPPGSDLKFHQLHGRNARVSMNGMTASRPNAHGEFNESIIMSNRPLRDAEVFEVSGRHCTVADAVVGGDTKHGRILSNFDKMCQAKMTNFAN